MAIQSDRLSLWEIGFRWHDLDPHAYPSVDAIPLEVKDTLRTLAAEVYNERLYSTLRLEREAGADYYMRRKQPWFSFKKPPKWALSDYHDEFQDCLERNVIDPAFLKQIVIPIWELEIWCRETETPKPSFWRTPDWLSDANRPKEESQTVKVEPETAEKASPIPKNPASQQQQAAHAKYSAGNQLKRDCAVFSLTKPGKSAPQIAGLFHSSLPDTKKRILTKATLEGAIREFRNRGKLNVKGKLPTWLVDFDPSAPQN